ncbi:hypothetical protein HTV45_31745 [Streptomyces sp. CHD11]|uniref:Rv3235 family protein n=1 Tax=Streptomyces sp. CHD11 TaxID=2741325 RepID=UPI001BFC90FA|nr:Rv3235 family protein [Streptomyces sp. CHD11]MBT3155368.1 hypothetical protein [Streptomyces sp. CHD11]
MNKVMTRHRRLPRPAGRTVPAPAATSPHRPAEGPAVAPGGPSPAGGTPRTPADRSPVVPPRPSAATATHLSPPGAGGTRPSPTGTAPPRTPATRTAPAPSPGGRRPAAGGLTRRPADNRPAGRAARGRGPAAPGTETPARGTRTVPEAGRAPLLVPRAGERPTRRPAVPPPLPTDRFAELLLAVLSGQRPVHAMLRHTAGQAYDELIRLAESGPLRTRGARPVVRDIGWFEPREGAIEAFARIGAGDRLRAMAFRLEQGRDLRWRCTAVELGGPRPRHPRRAGAH